MAGFGVSQKLWHLVLMLHSNSKLFLQLGLGNAGMAPLGFSWPRICAVGVWYWQGLEGVPVLHEGENTW